MGAVNLSYLKPSTPQTQTQSPTAPGPVASSGVIPPPWSATPGVNPWTGLPSGPQNPGGFWGEPPTTGSPFGQFTQNEPRTTDPGSLRWSINGLSAAQPWSSGSGSFKDWFLGQVNGKEYSQNTLQGLEGLLGQSGSALTPANAIGERTKIWDPQMNDWVRVFGVEPGWGSVWNAQGYNRDGTPKNAGGSGGSGGQTFSDPATAQWEQLLRTLNERLQQPQPTYTDAQRELMQTQAIDPLERQRQAALKNTQERLGARGITGGSGILEQAMQDVNRQFDQLRTGQQSQFALNQIGREDQLFNSNEQRALAGLNLMGQIPQYADKRLQMANSVLTPSNPYQLLSLQNQINQQGQYQQNYQSEQERAFWNWVGQYFMNQSGG